MLPMQRRRLTVFESKNRLARRRRRRPLPPSPLMIIVFQPSGIVCVRKRLIAICNQDENIFFIFFFKLSRHTNLPATLINFIFKPTLGRLISILLLSLPRDEGHALPLPPLPLKYIIVAYYNRPPLLFYNPGTGQLVTYTVYI